MSKDFFGDFDDEDEAHPAAETDAEPFEDKPEEPASEDETSSSDSFGEAREDGEADLFGEEEFSFDDDPIPSDDDPFEDDDFMLDGKRSHRTVKKAPLRAFDAPSQSAREDFENNEEPEDEAVIDLAETGAPLAGERAEDEEPLSSEMPKAQSEEEDAYAFEAEDEPEEAFSDDEKDDLFSASSGEEEAEGEVLPDLAEIHPAPEAAVEQADSEMQKPLFAPYARGDWSDIAETDPNADELSFEYEELLEDPGEEAFEELQADEEDSQRLEADGQEEEKTDESEEAFDLATNAAAAEESADEPIEPVAENEPIEPAAEESAQAPEEAEAPAQAEEETEERSGKEKDIDHSVSSDLIRGHINTIILRALYDGDKYGYEIIAEIERKSHEQYTLKQPSLYSALKRLEKDGYVTSYWGGSVSGGRRKYFSLTDQGKEISERNQSEWEYSRTVIDSLISDKDFDFGSPAPTSVDMRVLKKSVSRVKNANDEDEEDLYDEAFEYYDSGREPENENEPAETNQKEQDVLSAERAALEEERAKLEEALKAREEMLRVREEAGARREQELLEREFALQAEQERREQEAEEQRLFLESEAERLKAREEEQERAEAERERLRAEEEHERQLQEEARRAEEEAQKAEAERLQAEEEARIQAEEEERLRTEEEEAKAAAQAQEKAIAEAEEAARAEERQRAIAALIAQREEEEKRRAFATEIALARAEETERLRAEEEARRQAEEQARQAEEAARLQAEEEARRQAEEEARQAEEAARLQAEEEARRQAEEEARQAEEAARLQAEEEARRQAEEERLRAEEVPEEIPEEISVEIPKDGEIDRVRSIAQEAQKSEQNERIISMEPFAKERAQIEERHRQEIEEINRLHEEEMQARIDAVRKHDEAQFRRREYDLLETNMRHIIHNLGGNETAPEYGAPIVPPPAEEESGYYRTDAGQDYHATLDRIYLAAKHKNPETEPVEAQPEYAPYPSQPAPYEQVPSEPQQPATAPYFPAQSPIRNNAASENGTGEKPSENRKPRSARSIDGIDFYDLEERAGQDGIAITLAGGRKTKELESKSVSLVNKGRALFLSALMVFLLCLAEGSLALGLRAKFNLPIFYCFFIWGSGLALLLVTALLFINRYGERALRQTGNLIVNVIVSYALIVIIILIFSLAKQIDFTSINDLMTYIIFPAVFFLNIILFGVAYYIQIRPLDDD